MSVKVLVVDDSGFFRKRIHEILSGVHGIEVCGTATNGKEAIDKTRQLRPDVITMDYEMPVMDGVTAVRHIMAECPTPILMFSTLTYEGARVTLDALEAGAVDFLPKNFEDISRNASRMQEVLKERILQVAKSNKKVVAGPGSPPPAVAPRSQTSAASASGISTEKSRPQSSGAARVSPPEQNKSARQARKTKTIQHPVDLLVIGTSTGGPVALQKILTQLPANFPLPILLVQHMPATFTPAFAERLNSMSKLSVKQAADGDMIRKGHALLAPGGKQMLLKRSGSSLSVNIIEGDERLTYKPSVDLTFGSCSRSVPGKTLAIVLTGMGADGREGCRMMKGTGATVWTQSAKSCVVYGMPMAVDKAGYSDLSLDIKEVADRLISEFM